MVPFLGMLADRWAVLHVRRSSGVQKPPMRATTS